MAAGLFQPLNAFLRPHVKEGKKEKKRLLWELLHRGLGWSAIVLSVATISFGTQLTMWEVEAQAAYAAAWGFNAVLALSLLASKWRVKKQQPSDARAVSSDTTKSQPEVKEATPAA